MKPEDSVRSIKGIGEKTAALYRKLGIETVGALVRHYPKDYVEYELPTAIDGLAVGQVQTIEGVLAASPRLLQHTKHELLLCQVRDRTGSIVLKWFHQSYLKHQLQMGVHLVFRGKVSEEAGKPVMVQPEIFTVEQYRERMKGLKPIYATTEGLTQNAIGKAMALAMEDLVVPDYLEGRVRRRLGLTELNAALGAIHFPKRREDTIEAIKRLAFDEFLQMFLSIRMCQGYVESLPNAHPVADSRLVEQLIGTLPFTLTGAQQQAIGEILQDMAGAHPMQRLLEGDVGSGKTIVAMCALLACAEHGYQGCLMAPTEVLAEQHFASFEAMLKPFGISVGYLTGSMPASVKKIVHSNVRQGKIQILIGTHALIQESLAFKSLGLVVIDEQHRFGVKQREQLMNKGDQPHLLIMSATPIPRTLAMMLYGDMDLSVLGELPAERRKIKTCIIPSEKRSTAFRFIEEQLQAGHQAFVVCPMIEEGDGIEAENVTEYTERLQQFLQHKGRVACLHGRMKAAEKSQVMEAFASGRVQVLVSTTVIEVGVNVPNATVMMIENAERFGLATLHQLRGRVGRGAWQSYCILLKGSGREEAERRLSALLKTDDGFVLAEEDLSLRGPGDFFGIRQSGSLSFVMGDLIRDADMVKKAKEFAEGLNHEESVIYMEALVAKKSQSVIY